MDKLRTLLSHRNIGWRLLSLILAVFVWFVCITFIDPPKSATITVNLTLLNEDALTKSNKILQNRNDLTNKEIRIDVRGRTRIIDELNSASFTAYIDLGKAEILNAAQIGEYIATNVIVVNNNADVEITRQSPMEIGILLDEIIEKSFPVTVTPVGEVQEGYVAVTSAIQRMPETVRIRGARTALSAISYMSISANINDASDNVTLTDTPQAFDELGNLVEDFTFAGAKDITVTVPVYRKAMLLVQPPELKNAPAAGYIATNTALSSKQIEIMGPTADISKNLPITLDPIDLTGKNSTFTVECDLRKFDIGKNLSFVNPEDSIVTVTVTIEPEITKTLTVPVSELTVTGLKPGMEVETKNVTVTARGAASLLADTTKLDGTITIAEITTVGTYTFAVEWHPQNGITILDDSSSVRIIVRPEGTIPSETETDSDGEHPTESANTAETESAVPAETGDPAAGA